MRALSIACAATALGLIAQPLRTVAGAGATLELEPRRAGDRVIPMHPGAAEQTWKEPHP